MPIRTAVRFLAESIQGGLALAALPLLVTKVDRWTWLPPASFAAVGVLLGAIGYILRLRRTRDDDSLMAARRSAMWTARKMLTPQPHHLEQARWTTLFAAGLAVLSAVLFNLGAPELLCIAIAYAGGKIAFQDLGETGSLAAVGLAVYVGTVGLGIYMALCSGLPVTWVVLAATLVAIKTVSEGITNRRKVLRLAREGVELGLSPL